MEHNKKFILFKNGKYETTYFSDSFDNAKEFVSFWHTSNDTFILIDAESKQYQDLAEKNISIENTWEWTL